MNNNDLLIRLRYALDLKDYEMVKIFELGGIKLDTSEVKKILSKEILQDEEAEISYIRDNEDFIKCTNKMLDHFLDGLITYKRGPQDITTEDKIETVINDRNVNNIFLKKVKIALQLTSDDLLELFQLAGISISKNELSAVLRREGQRNYKECGDRYIRNFLKGLALKLRK